MFQLVKTGTKVDGLHAYKLKTVSVDLKSKRKSNSKTSWCKKTNKNLECWCW